MNNCPYISGLKCKYIFLIHFLYLFRIPFLFRIVWEEIINNTVKRRIFNSSFYLFSARDTLSFFAFDKLSKTSSTKSMIAWLNTNWIMHDLEAKCTSNCIFDILSKFTLFIVLLFFLLFFFNFWRRIISLFAC